jgi:hypothetical protein
MTEPLFYKGINLASDHLDTLILSGAGYYGLIFCGIIKCLEEYKLLQAIKYIYCVSAGTIFGLLIILGYTFAECMELMTRDIDISRLVTVSGKDILNLATHFGINDGSYLEESIKHILERKGYNPYITLGDLYERTGIEYHLGVTLVFKEKFEILSYKPRPDIPVWMAVRMSCSLPFIYYPIKDYVQDDYIVDGGILNNTPLRFYLDTVIKASSGLQSSNGKIMLDVGTQTGPDELESSPAAEPELITPALDENSLRYRMRFICVNTINIQEAEDGQYPGYNNIKKSDLADITLMDFISAFIHKLFYHQDCYQQKYKPYMLDINYAKYTFISHTNLQITPDQIEILINAGFTAMEQYYRSHLILNTS